MYTLEDLGWGPFFQQQLNTTETDTLPARVVKEMKGAYRVYCEDGLLTATVSGRLRHEVTSCGWARRETSSGWMRPSASLRRPALAAPRYAMGPHHGAALGPFA